jgi:protein TonB
MEIKKYPNASLENYSKVFVLLGLVLALFIVYEFINMKTFPKHIKNLSESFVTMEDDEQIVEIKPIETPQKPAPKVAKLDKIIQVEDEIEVQETVIESTESDEDQAVIVAEQIEEIVETEEEETIVEDVPFIVIEEVPIFPGCTGNRDELRACFSSQISKFVLKKFNAELASELGLEPGSIQKILVMFKINDKGEVTNIKARAPHKSLQAEAIRVINLLPKMTPGKQRGKPVGVSYGLPIVFRVQ